MNRSTTTSVKKWVYPIFYIDHFFERYLIIYALVFFTET